MNNIYLLILKEVGKIKLSFRTIYGLEALKFILNKNVCVSIKDIASKKNIPENYLEQIMGILKKAGLIKSIRGAKGGYILNCEPEKITIGDILKILENGMYFTDCLKKKFNRAKKINNIEACKNNCDCKKCHVKNIWCKMYKNMIDVADEFKLSDLICDDENICEEEDVS